MYRQVHEDRNEKTRILANFALINNKAQVHHGLWEDRTRVNVFPGFALWILKIITPPFSVNGINC
jgi:hypothetical protein